MKLRLLWLSLGVLIGCGLALLIVAWILTAQYQVCAGMPCPPVDPLPGSLWQLYA